MAWSNYLNNVTVGGSKQLLTPHSRDIYQIIEVNKKGFSFRLQNLRTLAKVTTVHARVNYLDLEDLNNFELGSHDLWETLTKLNIKKNFHQGESRKKLNLVHPEPQGEVTEGVEDDLGLGIEDNIIVEDDDENLLNKEDEDGNQTGGQDQEKLLIKLFF